MSKTQGKRTDPYYAAQDILSRRDHSVFEMRAKLKRKGFSTEQIDTVVTWLHAKKLLNDQQFTIRYVESTLSTKAVGGRWLTYRLKQKGVADTIINDVVSSVITSDVERELVQRAVDTWRRQHPQHNDDRERLQRFLISRGFSFEAIRADGESVLQPGDE